MQYTCETVNLEKHKKTSDLNSLTGSLIAGKRDTSQV